MGVFIIFFVCLYNWVPSYKFYMKEPNCKHFNDLHALSDITTTMAIKSKTNPVSKPLK